MAKKLSAFFAACLVLATAVTAQAGVVRITIPSSVLGTPFIVRATGNYAFTRTLDETNAQSATCKLFSGSTKSTEMTEEWTLNLTSSQRASVASALSNGKPVYIQAPWTTTITKSGFSNSGSIEVSRELYVTRNGVTLGVDADFQTFRSGNNTNDFVVFSLDSRHAAMFSSGTVSVKVVYDTAFNTTCGGYAAGSVSVNGWGSTPNLYF